MKRIYQVTTNHADAPEMNSNVSGNIKSVAPEMPKVISDFLISTVERFDEITIDMTFTNSLVEYKIKTCN